MLPDAKQELFRVYLLFIFCKSSINLALQKVGKPGYYVPSMNGSRGSMHVATIEGQNVCL